MAGDTKVKDTDTGTDAQGFPVSNGGEKAKGGARPKPTYKAEKISGDLPADLTLPRTGNRTSPEFIEALQVAQSDPGEFYCVATYESANGARTAFKRIKDKKVTIPAGDWDFETRRIEAPGSTEEVPLRWSKLFAKFLG